MSSPFFNFSNIQRAELFDSEVLKNLNTYRNWGTFCAPIRKVEKDEDEKNDIPLSNESVKSLFNPVYSVGYNQYMQIKQNAPLLDTPENRKMIREKKDCSIKGLVEASKQNRLGRAVYSYSDFMYCKYLGKLSNNYLITLRRFSFPCGDHIHYSNPWDTTHGPDGGSGTEQHNPDIGRLVTWMGTPGNDMSGILKYSVKMPFSEVKSGIKDGGGGSDKKSPLGTFLNATTDPKYRSQMVKGYTGASVFSYAQGLQNVKGKAFAPARAAGKLAQWGGSPPYSGQSSWDNSKIYGPLDVIDLTHKREIGLNFTQDISLTFDYELRSYDGINGKAAFLDLLGNILAVTYANGAFWGGAYRGTGSSQSNIFANLPIFKLNGSESFSDVVNSFVDSGHQIISGLGGNTGNFLESLKNIVSTIAKGAFSALLGAGLNALGRPEKHSVESLLSPMPVGFWHLTIGNPWNPIMTIGNLILDGADIEQYGPLGLDDFPTGIRVTCKLKHGKSRDATQIEQMYLLGENRIYTPADADVLEMYNNADPVYSKTKKKIKEASEIIKDHYRKYGVYDDAVYPELQEKDVGYALNFKDFETVKLLENEEGAIYGEEPDFDEEGYQNRVDLVITDMDKQYKKNELSKYFFQWFGVNDEEIITGISREAAFGSKRSGKDETGSMGKGR